MIRPEEVEGIITSGALVEMKISCGGSIVGILRKKNEGRGFNLLVTTNGSREKPVYPVSLKKINIFPGTKKTIREIIRKRCENEKATDFCVACLTFSSSFLPPH
jgi:hypothetical protein